jgi:excisionase family DNA binding protein
VYDHRGERRSERRVRLSEAAELLGVSKDAVRMRVKRGTLRSEKGEDGRVYVWVNVNPDGGPNSVHPQAEVNPYWELIDELHDRVRSLEAS